MANFELFSSTEYKSSSEYKEFKAEVYSSPNEFMPKKPEFAFTGFESKFTEPVTKPTDTEKKKKDKNGRKAKRFLDRISNSVNKIVGTVGGTVAAATTALIICSNVFTPSPKVDLSHIDVGADYVNFTMSVEELNPETNYDIVVKNGYDTFIIEEVIDGVNKNTVTGLRPFNKYTIQLITNEKGEKITHFEQDFYTLKENKVNFEYSAELLDITDEQITVDWGDTKNKITIDVPFTNTTDKNFGYRLTLTDQNQQIIGQHVGNETSISFDVNTNVEIATLSCEKVFIGDTFVHSYTETPYTLPIYLKSVQLEFLEKTLVSTNYYSIDFKLTSPIAEKEIIKSVSFTINGDDDYYLPITEPYLTDNVYTVFYEMLNYSETIEIQATVQVISYYGGQERLISESKTYDTPIELIDDIYYSLDYNEIVANFTLSAPQGSYVELNDGTNTYALDPLSLPQYVTPTGDGQVLTYTLYDANGVALTPTKSITFNTPKSYTYNILNYPNPSDVLVTYNDDGTMNLYLESDFTAESPDVIYEIVCHSTNAPDIRHRWENSLVAIENLPLDEYSLTYEVFYYENGVKYVLESVTPSGTTSNSGYYYVNCNASGTELHIQITKDTEFEMLNDCVLFVNNKKYNINLSDFIEETDGYNYYLDVGEQITSASLLYSAYGQKSLYQYFISDYEIKGMPFAKCLINFTII